LIDLQKGKSAKKKNVYDNEEGKSYQGGGREAGGGTTLQLLQKKESREKEKERKIHIQG